MGFQVSSDGVPHVLWWGSKWLLMGFQVVSDGVVMAGECGGQVASLADDPAMENKGRHP